MNLERNKAIVERYCGDLSRGNLAIVDAHVDPDYVAHDPNLPEELRDGIRNLKRVIGRSRAGFPDQRIEMDDVIAEGDGREDSFTGMSMFRIEGTRIAEAWFNFDHYSFLKQLDALPADTRDPDAAPNS